MREVLTALDENNAEGAMAACRRLRSAVELADANDLKTAVRAFLDGLLEGLTDKEN